MDERDALLVAADEKSSAFESLSKHASHLEVELKQFRDNRMSTESQRQSELYISQLEHTIREKSEEISYLSNELDAWKQRRAASPTASASTVQPSVETADTIFNALYNASQRASLPIADDDKVNLLKRDIAQKLDEIESFKELLRESEERVANYAHVSESSVKSMELYREELMKTTKKLELAEKEVLQLKSNIQLKSVGGDRYVTYNL
jgi:hypothetical protein